jgi:hypothetical protein
MLRNNSIYDVFSLIRRLYSTKRKEAFTISKICFSGGTGYFCHGRSEMTEALLSVLPDQNGKPDLPLKWYTPVFLFARLNLYNDIFFIGFTPSFGSSK